MQYVFFIVEISVTGERLNIDRMAQVTFNDKFANLHETKIESSCHINSNYE